MMKNNVAPERVFGILTQFAHHKKDRVFANELAEFLESEKEDYYFLSDDYYEHHLRYGVSGELTLIAVSEKEDILSRAAEANRHLKNLYINN